MYWAATWLVGVQPHQVMLPDVAEPVVGVDEDPELPQAAATSTITLASTTAVRDR
jgi:hypothetical protein